MEIRNVKEPRVFIIIINWNQQEDTIRCLNSLKSLDYKNRNVVLIDNGSVDGSPDRIKEQFPQITLIKNNENMGFAAGNNIGIRCALSQGADYILLLNNDTVVDSGMLKELINVAESDKKIGVVGAVNYSFEHRKKVVLLSISFNWFTGFTKKEDLDAISRGVITEPQQVHGVTGSSLLIKRAVVERIGLLDDRFFIYYEDTDWCMRARKAGYKVLYVPKAKIWHKVGTSFGQKSPAEFYLYTRNLPLFMLKNCPKVFIPSFFVFYILKITIYSLTFILTGNARFAQGIFLGFIDFLRRNFKRGHLDRFIAKG